MFQRFAVSVFVAALLLSSSPSMAAGKAKGKHPAAAAKSAKSKQPQVVLQTSKGTIVIALNVDKAPISSKNFLDYVKRGFYTGTVFHRVIADFMIQGGGFTKDLLHKEAQEPIKNEADNGLQNVRGTVVMARTNVVDSATSQFFINVKDNHQLDHSPANFGYAVFGEVVSGMDVVDAIRRVPTRCPSSEPGCNDDLPPGMRDVPREPVIIVKASVKA